MSKEAETRKIAVWRRREGGRRRQVWCLLFLFLFLLLLAWALGLGLGERG